MLCCGKCSCGCSVSGHFCCFLTFSLLSAYIQSDSKAAEAEKSCSYVATEVSQGTAVCYWAACCGNSYPSQQGRKPPQGFRATVHRPCSELHNSAGIWKLVLEQVCRRANDLTVFWEGAQASAGRAALLSNTWGWEECGALSLRGLGGSCSDLPSFKGFLKSGCSCSLCCFVGLLV